MKRIAGALRRTTGRGPLASLPPEIREIVERDLALLDDRDRKIAERAIPMTMTGVPRIHALVDAVRYCVRRDVPGAFAECGVWMGGSVVAMLLALQELGVSDRDIYLYDTFEGMTAPTEHDVSRLQGDALGAWREAERSGGQLYSELFGPEVFSEERVRENVLAVGYPAERIHFVKGKVEETIPDRSPPGLALLRLDTDWYESTRHELVHLFPLLAEGGVLIVDDYGDWEGSRRAVDEYFADRPPLLLNRIDFSARIAVKA